MSITGMGIDAVLQFDPAYLGGVVRRELEERTHCLDTGGGTVRAGGSVVRASDVTAGYEVSGFSSGSNGPTVDVTVTATDGTLAVGPDASSLRTTGGTTLSFPLSVRTASSNGRVVELVAETGLPGLGDVGVAVLDYADLDIDFPNLNAPGVSFDPEPNPGTVKRLPGGTIAVGLLTTARGSGTSGFEANYTDDELGPGTDWALVLDHSMVETYVSAMGPSIEKNSRIRTVKDLDLRRIAGSTLKIRVKGHVSGTDFCSHADVDLIATGNRIDYDYHVTTAWQGIRCRRGLKVTRYLSSSDRNGRDVFFPSATLSPPGVAMDLSATGVRIESGEVVIEGTATPSPPDDARVAVAPEMVTLGMACSGAPATSEAVTVTHPKRSNDQVDLAVCDLSLSGRDAGDFSVAGGPSTPYSVPPGATRRHTVTYTGSPTRTARATLAVATSAATETVDLVADLGQGVVSVPGSVSVTGDQELTSCRPPDNSATATVAVRNTGTGGVEFCRAPAITNASGGRWSVTGAAESDVIPSGSKEDLTVTYVAPSGSLGHRETATLRLDTSAGTHTVSLTGRVDEAEGGHGGAMAGGVRIGPIEVGHDVICAGPAELGKYIEAWEEIHRRIFGDEGVGAGPWNDVEPVCCPPPQQPRCLCRPGMQVSTDGFPEGTRFEVRDPAIGERAFFEPRGGAESFVVPLSPETEFEVDLDADGSVDRSREVSLDFRRLAVTREDVHESDGRLAGVAAAGDLLATTTADAIRTFSVDESGQPNPASESGLEREPSGIAGVDDLLVAHGPDGYEAFVTWDGGIDRVAAADIPMDVLVADRHGDRERIGFAVRDGELTAVDLSIPGDPDVVAAAETALDAPHAGFAMGSRLALAGEDGVEVWSVADAAAPERLGGADLEGVTAVFCDEGRTHAATADGRIATFAHADGDLERVGGARLPESWSTLRPRGSPALLGARAVVRTAAADGFNVFGVRVGRYGETDAGADVDVDLDDLPDRISDAIRDVGMELDDLLERTVGVDLIEDERRGGS